jgi:hypothetical protein
MLEQPIRTFSLISRDMQIIVKHACQHQQVIKMMAKRQILT